MAYTEIPVRLPVQTRAGYLIVPVPEEVDLLNAAAVRKVLRLTGTDELVEVCLSLGDALAASYRSPAGGEHR
jgi:hypothetical protein